MGLSLSLVAMVSPAVAGNLSAKVEDAGEVSSLALSNDRLELACALVRGKVGRLVITDRTSNRKLDLGEPFTLAMKVIDENDTSDAAEPTIETAVTASQFIAGTPVVSDIAAVPDARRLIERAPGKRVTVDFAPLPDGLSAKWEIELRDGAGYVRQTLTLIPLQGPADVHEIRLFDFKADDAHTAGKVAGSPVIIGTNTFAGVEHPMSSNKVAAGRVTGSLDRKVAIGSRRACSLSSVIGFTAPGQLRREFQLGYINRERARPYAPYLNYNTWYDIGYFTRYDEKSASDVVKTYGEELVRKRGVKFDSFLFDDGWDDVSTLWKFDKGFPQEFQNVSKLATSYGASPGVWFSPWGGYGKPKDQRIAAAKEKNPQIETNTTGFALSGPHYYQLFRDMCLHMIRDNGIRHFKFDGTGDAGSVQPGSKFGSDFEAVIALIDELRHEQSDLYINLTTGTWASPFWFRTADSIWRGGYDHEFLGTGTQRQRWMTYRDGMTYRYNVAVAPLFPINSLMLHGVLMAKGARDLNADPADDLTAEIWSGFGCGTQMEELYITPSLLSQKNWDTLATAAKWAKTNTNTLVDTHWIGGDPLNLEVYGWASWSPDKGIIVLRNPSDKAQPFTADPAALFELPLGAPTRFKVSSPNGSTQVSALAAGTSTTITLKPFEVIVLEALPAR
ncbi:MAG: enterotoxin [Luteolibacter sp.]